MVLETVMTKERDYEKVLLPIWKLSEDTRYPIGYYVHQFMLFLNLEKEYITGIKSVEKLSEFVPEVVPMPPLIDILDPPNIEEDAKREYDSTENKNLTALGRMYDNKKMGWWGIIVVVYLQSIRFIRLL